MVFQVLVSMTSTELFAGFPCSSETNILEPSMENAIWNGLGVLPVQPGSLTWVIRFQLRGSGSETSNTPMLFWRVLFVIVKNLPSGLNPHSWPDVTTLSSAISQIPSAIFLTGMLSFGDPSGAEMQATGSMVVRSMTTPTANIRRVTIEKRLPG